MKKQQGIALSENFLDELCVIVVYDGKVFGDIHICNIHRSHMIESFVNIRLTEAHEVTGESGECMPSLVEV